MAVQRAILTINKFTSIRSLRDRMRHNNREKQPDNADINLKHLNTCENNLTGVQVAKSYREKLGNHIPRKNAVMGIEVLLSASPDFFKGNKKNKFTPLDSETEKQWYEKSKEWVSETFGKDNILEISFHKDESTPHIHILIIPMHEEKLRAHLWLDGSAKLSELQTTYHKAVEEFGLKRGVKGTHRKQVPLWKAKKTGEPFVTSEKMEKWQNNINIGNEKENKKIADKQKEQIEDIKKQEDLKLKQAGDLKLAQDNIFNLNKIVEDKKKEEEYKAKKIYEKNEIDLVNEKIKTDDVQTLLNAEIAKTKKLGSQLVKDKDENILTVADINRIIKDKSASAKEEGKEEGKKEGEQKSINEFNDFFNSKGTSIQMWRQEQKRLKQSRAKIQGLKESENNKKTSSPVIPKIQTRIQTQKKEQGQSQ